MTGWEAHLQLGFWVRRGRTVLITCKHCGPLLVQRPFYPEGEICHVYLLHPPGGVVAGDRLGIEAEVAPDAHALLTTPAAGKFYRSAGSVAVQQVTLTVRSGGTLEWLPQEGIFYRGARAVVEIAVALAEGARFLGWEGVCLGRPAAAESFSAGKVRLGWSLTLDGEPLLVERFDLDSKAQKASWGLRGQPGCASLYAYPADLRLLELARRAGGEDCGATLVDDLLIWRGLGQMADLRSWLEAVWRALRPALLGRAACPPRVWAT